MKLFLIPIVLSLVSCATPQSTSRPESYLADPLGSNMDLSDHEMANEALESGSENKSINWINAATGRRFSVKPTRTYKIGNQDCRDFTAIYGGRTISGAACRDEDGVWVRSYLVKTSQGF